MRVRRSAALVGCALVLGACGRGEPAPEFGAAPEVPDATVVAPTEGTDLIGQTAGELLQVTSRTAGDTPVEAPPGPAEDPAVQALCDRTAIFQVTAGGMTRPSRAQRAQLERSMTQLLQDGSLLYGVIGDPDEARLTRCLDLAVEAVS